MAYVRDTVVEYEGEEKAWKELAKEEYMAEIFCKKGFEAQNYKQGANYSTGLYQLVVEFAGSTDPAVIKSVCKELLADVQRKYISYS